MKNILFQALCAAAWCSAGLLGACGSSETDEQMAPVGGAGEGGASDGGLSGSNGANDSGASTGGVSPGSGGASTGGQSPTTGGAGGGAGMGGSSGTDGGTEPVCSLPPDSGPCDAAIPRFYYDPNIGDCVEFTYGGCQGNANNFATVEACRQACGGSADICTLPVVPGPCRGAFQRWFFNSSTGQCEEFVYGGCEGNANNFETEEACANACASPSTCGCIGETISWGNVGGLVAYVDRSEVVPCATFSHRRDPTFTDPISIECSQELMACPGGRLGLSDLLASLANADITAARAAAPVLYGRDLRPVDAPLFQIVIGADVIEVGADCTGAPGCVAIPDGVTALVELLRALDAQELGMGDCGQAFGG